MDQFHFFRQLNAKLAAAPNSVVCATYLVVTARLEEIDLAVSGVSLVAIVPASLVAVETNRTTKSRYVIEPLTACAVGRNQFSNAFLPAEALKNLLAWQVRNGASLDFN